MNDRKVILTLVGLLGTFGISAEAQLPQPRLGGVDPVAMTAGESGELGVKGKDLEGPQRLLFSHPEITAEVIQKEDPLLKRTAPVEDRFTVKVNPGVPPGIYDVRLAGSYGASNALGFAVTDLPLVARQGGDEVQKIELNQAVCGVMPNERELAFAIPMMPGQSARVLCYGRRLGSRLDAVLKVVGPDGKEVASSSGAGRTADAEVAFTAEVAGDYAVTFFDYIYKGGDGYGYLLEFRGGKTEPAATGDGDGWIKEDEGKDGEPGFVQNVGFPARIAGRFARPGDRDAFEVEAGGGTKVVVDVRSDRLGEMTDPVVAVDKVEVDGEGKEVLKAVVNGDDWNGPGGRELGLSHRDPTVAFEASGEKGRYRISVWNRFPVQGERGRYRLEIMEPKPDFSLVATAEYEGLDGNKLEPVSPVVRAGGSAKIEVFALREGGFEGAIDLRVEGLPGGVTADAIRIPEGREGAVVVIRAAAGTGAWAGKVKVVGEADFGGAKVKREAGFRGGLWAINDMNKEEIGMRDAAEMVVGVSGEEAPDVKLELPGGVNLESCKGGKVAIPVKLAMGEGVALKGNVTVVPVGFDRYPKPPNVGIAPDKKEGVLTLDFKDGGGNVFQPGEFVMVLRGECQFDYEPSAERKEAAEKEKGEMETAVKALEEEVGKLATAKSEAGKRLEEAKKMLGELKDAGDARNRAEAAVKEAETVSAAAVQAEADLRKRIEDGKKAVQAAVQRVKQETDKMKKRQAKFAAYSTPVMVKLATSPIVVTAPAEGTVAAGEKGELVVKIERKYGFNQNVQLVLSAPGDTKGIKLNMPAVNGENGKDATVTVEAAGDSAVGELELTLSAKGNFNGVNFEEKAPVKIKVTPKKEEPAAANP